ncbi:hypothetical protein DFJ77DRAFT_462484 [Powellomyces hirtus]|nr:hypothetical protein DFJ77DRAFT_462484 [Powellomyces hirtus]
MFVRSCATEEVSPPSVSIPGQLCGSFRALSGQEISEHRRQIGATFVPPTFAIKAATNFKFPRISPHPSLPLHSQLVFFAFLSLTMFSKSIVLIAIAAVTFSHGAAALEDPRTTKIKSDLTAFCSSLNGAQGAQGENCFNIFGTYTGSILAAKKNDPCDRTVKAQALLDNFPNVPGVVELAKAMSTAPINVIPPEQLPGLEIACPTPLRVNGASAAPAPAPAPAPSPAPVPTPAPPAGNGNGNGQGKGNGKEKNGNGNGNGAPPPRLDWISIPADFGRRVIYIPCAPFLLLCK